MERNVSVSRIKLKWRKISKKGIHDDDNDLSPLTLYHFFFLWTDDIHIHPSIHYLRF